ncbi:hypothetical protein HYFRA_00008613 [Hymenoscyphus fraxineus]|uniref:Uncharacterized protein n=1 Tax=Hymenoscyphus fraxineus TaxID=746836 RepID=A0A9N9KV87_9HELO|nr:hypothetical protein HYFRA_00008613 [Hymenoscyphus fraxineus]
MDPSNVELLVHISAPSTSRDDARYRALARAYLNFVPATRLELEKLPDDDEETRIVDDSAASLEEVVEENSQFNARLGSQVRVEEEAEVKSWESFRPGQEEEDEDDDGLSEALPTQSFSQEHRQSFCSAELSFRSVANNADSPPFRNQREVTCAQLSSPIQRHVESQKSTDSWIPPRSTISDSQPEYNRPSQALSSPTRVSEQYLQRLENAGSGPQETGRSQRQKNRDEASSGTTESQKTSTSDIRDFAFDETSSSVRTPMVQQENTPGAPPTTIPATSTPIAASSLEISPTPISTPGKLILPSEIMISFKLRSGNVPSKVPSSSVRSSSPNVVNKTTIPKSSENIETTPMVRRAIPISENSTSIMSRTTNVENPASNIPSSVSTNSDIITIPRKSMRNIPRTPYRAMNSTGDSSIALKRKMAEKRSGFEVPDSAADVESSISVIPETIIKPPAKRTKFTLTRPISSNSSSNARSDDPSKLPATLNMEQPNKPQNDTSPSNTPSTPTRKQPDKFRSDSTPSKTKGPTAQGTPRSTPVFSSPPSASQLPTHLDKTEARPRPPPTGTGHIDPKSFITPALHGLAEKDPNGSLYKPLHQVRELRPTERGYWRVDTTNWEPGFKEKCWSVLANFILQEKGGWGISCVRTEDFKEIQVYCWGITVPYVYLLIFMASSNRVRSKGRSWWIGGDGNPLITMPVVPRPTKK